MSQSERRDGVTNKLKREKAVLQRKINTKPWERATQSWRRIDNIDAATNTLYEHFIFISTFKFVFVNGPSKLSI